MPISIGSRKASVSDQHAAEGSVDNDTAKQWMIAAKSATQWPITPQVSG
jgi:hypothetical protein